MFTASCNLRRILATRTPDRPPTHGSSPTLLAHPLTPSPIPSALLSSIYQTPTQAETPGLTRAYPVNLKSSPNAGGDCSGIGHTSQKSERKQKPRNTTQQRQTRKLAPRPIITQNPDRCLDSSIRTQSATIKAICHH